MVNIKKNTKRRPNNYEKESPNFNKINDILIALIKIKKKNKIKIKKTNLIQR